MRGTSCGENCPFVKQGFCKTDKECPHYCENTWQNKATNEIQLIADCSPKRLLMQQNQMETRLEGVERSLEEFRNQYIEMSNYLKNLIEMSKTVILQNDTRTLENKKTLLIENSEIDS